MYELEDIKKKSGESANELVDRIRQMARLAEIGNGSNEAIEFEVQHRLIRAIPDEDIDLRKEMLKVDRAKGTAALLELACTYYRVEAGAQ